MTTATSEERELAEFERISVSNAISATLTKGEVNSVTVSGDDNVVPLVLTEVGDGTLTVRFKDNTSVTTKTPLKVEIVAKAWPAGLDLSGASRLETADFEGEKLQVEVSGASRITLTGKVARLTVEASGASSAELSGLAAKTAQVDASGASTIEVQASQSIQGEASGASRVTHSGGASNVNVESSGASTVKSAG